MQNKCVFDLSSPLCFRRPFARSTVEGSLSTLTLPTTWWTCIACYSTVKQGGFSLGACKIKCWRSTWTQVESCGPSTEPATPVQFWGSTPDLWPQPTSPRAGSTWWTHTRSQWLIGSVIDKEFELFYGQPESTGVVKTLRLFFNKKFHTFILEFLE